MARVAPEAYPRGKDYTFSVPMRLEVTGHKKITKDGMTKKGVDGSNVREPTRRPPACPPARRLPSSRPPPRAARARAIFFPSLIVIAARARAPARAQEIIDRMYMKEVKCKKNENWCERISLFYQPHIM